MKKRISLLFIGSFVIFGLFMGCSKSTASAAAKSDAKLADEINIIVWDSTWSEDVFKDFQNKYGIKVNVSYISDTSEIISKLVQGDVHYDLVDIESAYVKSFVDNHLLTELNYSEIPNKDNIKPAMFGMIGDEKSEYTIPCLAPLYTSILYNKATCPIKITKFSDLADPALKNQVCMVNSTISLFGMALQALGYKADSVNENQIRQAYDLLKNIKKNVKVFVGETAVSQLENNECSVAFCWDYPVLMGEKANWDKYAIVPLSSGDEYSGTFWGVPTSSQHQKEAEMLINFELSPEEYAKNMIAYPNDVIIKKPLIEKYLPDGYYDNPAYNLPDSLVNNAWKVAVSDDQIDLLDKYYTLLMGE